MRDRKRIIVTCIKNTHPLYDDSFNDYKIIIGKQYLCIEYSIALTSSKYRIPEFASLAGVTLFLGRRWTSKNQPCFPKECFRIATIQERKGFYKSYYLKLPLNLIKAAYYKIYWKSVRAYNYLTKPKDWWEKYV